MGGNFRPKQLVIFTEICKKPTIHSLRHSFGSERAGTIDALILRDLMGHKNLRTTQQYAKVNPEASKKAFQQFDRDRLVKR